jgi:hypothetical protein
VLPDLSLLERAVNGRQLGGGTGEAFAGLVAAPVASQDRDRAHGHRDIRAQDIRKQSVSNPGAKRKQSRSEAEAVDQPPSPRNRNL